MTLPSVGVESVMVVVSIMVVGLFGDCQFNQTEATASENVRKIIYVIEALWGTRVSSGTVSNLNQKIYKNIEAWRNRPIEGEYPYVFLDGLVLKRTWAGEVRNVSVLAAIGVGTDGYRKVLGIAEGAKEDKSGWSAFLKHL